MATKIIMPKLGLAMKEGVLAKWSKPDGAEVRKDEEIGVVMSKKITYKLLAPEAGILRHVVKEKDTRPINAVLAFITAPGEPVPAVDDSGVAEAAVAAGGQAGETAAPTPAPTPAAVPARTGFIPASPAARRLAKEQGVDLGRVTGTGADGLVTEADVKRFLAAPAPAPTLPQAEVPAAPGVLATSAARKLAAQRGLNLAEVKGTGVGGRVTEQDVLAYGAAPAADAAALTGGRILPFVGMRQAIAENMLESLRGMAQLTLMIEVDVTELVKLRTQLKTEYDLTYTDLLIKAVAKTLKRHPVLNATLVGDEIHLLEAVHIGVAVALAEGLIVPVVRDADKRSVPEIAQEVRRLAQGARDNSLSVDEVTGSTFTITNLGNYGVDGFTPIINAPEAAILGVGRIADNVAEFQGDQVVRRAKLRLSLTIDHRLVDGAPAADFLKALKDLLENPYRLLV
jgi:pyruvate dehydrogenase E2 component (dihydrolipoamide acetyltransferase)